MVLGGVDFSGLAIMLKAAEDLYGQDQPRTTFHRSIAIG